MTVVLGVGGILAEAVADVAIRLVPIERGRRRGDDRRPARRRRCSAPFRGEPAVDRERLVDVLLGLSGRADRAPRRGVGRPQPADRRRRPARRRRRPVEVRARERVTPRRTEQFRALFDPRGVVVAGASTHPGKFGFVALHNILAVRLRRAGLRHQPRGHRGARRRDRARHRRPARRRRPTSCSCARRRRPTPTCCATPRPRASGPRSWPRPATARRARRACAPRTSWSRWPTSSACSSSGRTARASSRRPSSLCAQIVAPYPPAGRIGIASQSGNFVSSFMNYACASGVGVSRAVSAGNAAQVGVTDFLEFYADDPETDVALAYVEGVTDGRALLRERLAPCAERMPVVLVKGGATVGRRSGPPPATPARWPPTTGSSTACAARPASCGPRPIEEAYEAAATFATQPLPTGTEVAVVTHGRRLGRGHRRRHRRHRPRAPGAARRPDRRARRRSCRPAGAATTRSTWPAARRRTPSPTVLEIVARHPDVDAIVLLGMGIQSNQGRMERGGPLLPGPRARAHRRLPRPPGRAVHDRPRRELADELGKPVLIATELAVTSPEQRRGAGATAERRQLCYPSSNRAVSALAHLWEHARWRQRRGSETVPQTRRLPPVSWPRPIVSSECPAAPPPPRVAVAIAVRRWSSGCGPVSPAAQADSPAPRRRGVGPPERSSRRCCRPAGCPVCSPPTRPTWRCRPRSSRSWPRPPPPPASPCRPRAGRSRASNGDLPVVPASTEKLLTATAVLERLGDDGTVTTAAVADAGP